MEATITLPAVKPGQVLSIKSPYQRNSMVIKIDHVSNGYDGTKGKGIVICFARRIKIQARKYRPTNQVRDRDFFIAREKVYSFKRSYATETNQVQGHTIPDAYLEVEND